MTDPQLVKIIQKAIEDEVRPLKEQPSVMNEKLDALQEVKEILEDRVYPSAVEIENTIKAYRDMYKINKGSSKKLDKRLGTVEDKPIKPFLFQWWQIRTGISGSRRCSVSSIRYPSKNCFNHW